MGWAEIVARVRELDRADPNREIFAADAHAYRFAPPLTEEAVARFEREAAIALPDDYRRFLIEVGDGGAGPYHGILSLDASLEETPLEALREPFPYTRAIDFFAQYSEHPPMEHIAVMTRDAAYRARVTEKLAALVRDDMVAGTLCVCHYGCGDRYRLVVTGPQRGRMWHDGIEPGSGIFPMNESFTELYERWLDASFARIAAHDFTPSRGPRELAR